MNAIELPNKKRYVTVDSPLPGMVGNEFQPAAAAEDPETPKSPAPQPKSPAEVPLPTKAKQSASDEDIENFSLGNGGFQR